MGFEHLIAWALIIAAINHYTMKAFLPTLIYPCSWHILNADQTYSFGCHVIFFCLPTTLFKPPTTHHLSPSHHHLAHKTHSPLIRYQKGITVGKTSVPKIV